VPQKDPRRGSRASSVFLNIPYDIQFKRLYLAYISGLISYGLIPRATLEIPGSTRRLDRILTLIQTCEYSIHDLSRVQLDRKAPRTPRFNMPFELGLAVAWSGFKRRHSWYVCESVPHRALKSLSDINGTEIYVHDGAVRGVLREICNAFVRRQAQPSVPQMYAMYRALSSNLLRIMNRAGTTNPYTARVFQDLCLFATDIRPIFITSSSARKR
jgi:hypothetical protein